MSTHASIVVFSDLDGTLLDRETYSACEARQALDFLEAERIPVVFCSSKTRAEIQLLQQELGIHHPFICENGGALYIPDGYFPFNLRRARALGGYQVVEYGRPYSEVVATLHRAAERLGLTAVGFSDMTVEEVASECRLSLLGARLAKLREYDEPFRIVDADATARTRLTRALHAARLGCLEGGRFEHAGALVDKGTVVGSLAALYEREGRGSLTVGLGDASNDVSLLRQVDVPVVVHHGDLAAVANVLERVPTAMLTRAPGPRGWADAVLEIVHNVQHGRTPAPTLPSRRGVW